MGLSFSAPPANNDPNERGFYPRLYYADIGYENLLIFD
jgi:hypothetical protein